MADYYLHGKPKVGKWRDMHIRMSGPIVQAYEELFWKMWGKTAPSPLPLWGSASKPQHSYEEEKALPQKVSVEGAVASRWPKESPEIMRQTYVICIDNAERLVQIVNPYAML